MRSESFIPAAIMAIVDDMVEVPNQTYYRVFVKDILAGKYIDRNGMHWYCYRLQMWCADDELARSLRYLHINVQERMREYSVKVLRCEGERGWRRLEESCHNPRW